jgi:hypothetical protein
VTQDPVPILVTGGFSPDGVSATQQAQATTGGAGGRWACVEGSAYGACLIFRQPPARLLAAMCCSMVARGPRGMVLSR